MEEKLQLEFNRKLTADELESIVKEHLRFQVTRVFRFNDNPVKMDREIAKKQGLAEAKDLTLDEVVTIYGKKKNNENTEDQGGWDSVFNHSNLKVTQDEKGLVTIEVLDNLFTREEMTSVEKINSTKALNQEEGYKIGVHVGKSEYKIQLNTESSENSSVTGKFIK